MGHVCEAILNFFHVDGLGLIFCFLSIFNLKVAISLILCGPFLFMEIFGCRERLVSKEILWFVAVTSCFRMNF